MTPNGNFEALLRILDDRERERVQDVARREAAWAAERSALITAALTVGILCGLAGTVLCVTVWWMIR